MGGLCARLRRLEEAAEEDTMLLILPDTGEEVRVPFDAPIEWAVAEWCRETGQPHEPGPTGERMAELVARGAHEKNPDRDGRVLGGGRRGA
jgi:hypothetical protein